MNSLIRTNPSIPSNFISNFLDDDFFMPMSKVIDEFFRKDATFRDIFEPEIFTKSSYPKADVLETKNEITIICEIPGLKKDDIEISLKEKTDVEGYSIVEVSGNKQQIKEKEDTRYLYRELKHSQFCRPFYIKTDISDFETTSITFEDSILKIVIPKKPEQPKIESNTTKLRIK